MPACCQRARQRTKRGWPIWTPNRPLQRRLSVSRCIWTAAEAQLRELLADTMDRRANLAAKYPRTRDTNTRIKLSAEIRQGDTAIMGLKPKCRNRNR